MRARRWRWTGVCRGERALLVGVEMVAVSWPVAPCAPAFLWPGGGWAGTTSPTPPPRPGRQRKPPRWRAHVGRGPGHGVGGLSGGSATGGGSFHTHPPRPPSPARARPSSPPSSPVPSRRRPPPAYLRHTCGALTCSCPEVCALHPRGWPCYCHAAKCPSSEPLPPAFSCLLRCVYRWARGRLGEPATRWWVPSCTSTIFSLDAVSVGRCRGSRSGYWCVVTQAAQASPSWGRRRAASPCGRCAGVVPSSSFMCCP